MMHSHPNSERDRIDHLCDEYFDGSMSSADARGFKLRLVREPELASAVYAHGRIVDTLSEQMTAPDLTDLEDWIDRLAEEQTQGTGTAVSSSAQDGGDAPSAAAGSLRKVRVIGMVALAAGLMLFCWLFGAASTGDESSSAQMQLAQSWSSSLADAVAAGAAAVLATGGKLRRDAMGRWRLDRFGTSLLLPVQPICVRDLPGIPSAATLVFDDGHALVVMPKDDDPRPRFDECRPRLSQRFFRRELQTLVVYEATSGEGSELLARLAEAR